MTETVAAWELSRMAGCGNPDSEDSNGARWLLRVASDLPDLLKSDYPEDDIAEYADGAVPVMTHNRWEVFTDLCAYEEDISDFGADYPEGGMTAQAGVALYMIADRLLRTLLTEAAE